MTPASSKTMIIWLEDRVNGLEKRLEQVERYNKPIATPDVMRQARWMPIPKPLTDAEIYESYRSEFDIMLTDSGAQNTIKRFARAIERAHGIGEKE
jgi:hypothetical protein